MERFGEGDLLDGEVVGTGDGGPGGGGVPASFELAVLGCVAALAVRRGEMLRDHETAVFEGRLPVDGPVTIEAVHVLRRMGAHFELVDDRGGFAAMAFGALAGRPDEAGGGLAEFSGGSLTMEQKRGDEHRGGDDDHREEALKPHGGNLRGAIRSWWIADTAFA